MATDLVEVHGTFLNASREPLHGTVIFSPCVAAPLDSGPPENTSAIIPAVPITAGLDAEGRFSVLLVPSDDSGWRTDCPAYYEVDIRVAGLRSSYHVSVPEGGPHDLADLVKLDEAPNVAVILNPGPQGPAGIPGAGGAGWATDLGSVAAGVPITIEHGLSTTDVDVQVLMHSGSGAPWHEVEADVEIVSLQEVSVTFTGDFPTDPGSFRVLVRALGASAEAV